jgi:Zn-dependent protease
MNLILVVIGVVIGVSAAAYGAVKPRAKGEPFDTRRKVSLGVTLLGLLLVLWGAALTVAEA